MKSNSTNLTEPGMGGYGTDLSKIAGGLRRRFHGMNPRGYVRGKTRIRNAVMDIFGFSAMKAEALVEQLQSRGFVRYSGNPREMDTGRDTWRINTQPAHM